MRALRLLAGWATALVVHLLLVTLVPEVARLVDPFLLLIAFQAMGGNLMTAMIVGTVVGLTQDAVTGGLYGLHGLAGTVVGYVMARAARVLTLQKSYYVALFFALAVLVQQLVLQGLLLMLMQSPELVPLGDLALRVGLAGPVGGALVAVVDRLGERFQTWRRMRRPRISLE